MMDTQKMKLSDLSKYRSELMGFAMILVVWHHLAMNLPLPFYAYFKQNGGFGVDIFLLLSGLGLYYSTHKVLNLKEYYIKRAIRIFPIYTLVICIVTLIAGPYNISTLLLKVTTIGRWYNYTFYEWYIPNIVLLYLVYPLFLKLLQIKNNNYGLSIACIFIFSIYILAYFLPYGSQFIQYFRYPTFFLGVILGNITIRPRPIIFNYKINYFFIFTLLIGIALSIYGYQEFFEPNRNPYKIPIDVLNGWRYRPYFLMTPGLCLLLCVYFSYGFNKHINHFLSIIGNMSIEVYLLHIPFIDLTRWLTNTYNLSKPLLGAILVITSFIVSYYVHLLNIRIMEWLKNTILPQSNN